MVPEAVEVGRSTGPSKNTRRKMQFTLDSIRLAYIHTLVNTQHPTPHTMKVTFTIDNEYAEHVLSRIQPLSTSDAFKWLDEKRFEFPAYKIKRRVGLADAFRDKVELNQLQRAGKTPAMETGKRKGYWLVTFNF